MRVTFWVVILATLLSALAGCGGEDFEFTKATSAQVRALVNDRLGSDADGTARVRSVDCSNRKTCVVRYVVDEPVVDVSREILEDQRPVWGEMFKDRQLANARLEAYGTTVSSGGKDSVGAVLRLTCDREANRRIDWDNVTAEGMRDLCDYRALVNVD